MMKIEAVIHPFKLAEIKAALHDLDCEEVTISEVLHDGGSKIQKRVYRGCEYRADVPKVKVETLVSAHRVDEILEMLASATGAASDSTILVYEVAEAIRIRNGRRSEVSLS